MTPWWQQRMVSLDLETTSADPEEARMVSAAVVFVGGGEPTEAWTSLVNPGVEIPQEAIDVHGISNERVQAEGIDPQEALDRIVRLLCRLPDAAAVVFNARYDLTVLDRELRRFRPVSFYENALQTPRIVDPIVIERHLDRYRPKRVASHSLEDCCRVWNVELDGAHDAAFDAVAAARLAYRLAKSGRVIRRTRNDHERREFIGLTAEWESVRHDLAKLHAWQRSIAWEEAGRLEAYFRAGDASKDVPPQPDRVVPREWPVIPVGAPA